jgi:hypothetical protein
MQNNKARRHELKMLHYKKRLNKYCIKEDGIRKLYAFRSHGKPCSCWMCSPEKYSRAKQKARFLKFGVLSKKTK